MKRMLILMVCCWGYLQADVGSADVPLLPEAPDNVLSEAGIQALIRERLAGQHQMAEYVRWGLQALTIGVALAMQDYKKGDTRANLLKKLVPFSIVGGLTEASLRAALDNDPAWETSAMSAALWASLAALLGDSTSHKVGAAAVAALGSLVYHGESLLVNDWTKRLIPDQSQHSQRCFTRLGLYTTGFALQALFALFIMYLVKGSWREVPAYKILTLTFGVPFVGQFLAESIGAWIAAGTRTAVLAINDGVSPDQPNYATYTSTGALAANNMITVTIPGPSPKKNVSA